MPTEDGIQKFELIRVAGDVNTLGGPDFLGAQSQCIECAEASAILSALFWLAHCSVTIAHIHFDACAVGWATAGTGERCDGPAVDVIRGARAFAHVLELMGTTIHWGHTKAHEGHPWNSVADGLAKAAADMEFRAPHGCRLPPAWHASAEFGEWWWLWALPTDGPVA